MKVPERDWLLLRARLRAFASAVALPVVVASGYVAEDDDEDVGDLETERRLEIAQVHVPTENE